MNEISKVLNRHVAKNDESKDRAHILRELEEITAQVTGLEALVNRHLVRSLHCLEASWLAFEANFLRLALRERTDPEQPKKRIETIADLEAALRSRPH